MIKKPYEQQLKNINDWVEIVNYYWIQLDGVLHANTEFWNNTLHAMSPEDWWDWIEIAPALKAQHRDEWQRHNLVHDTKAIEKKLMMGKPVVKKMRPESNRDAFRTLMKIKDFINDINGTPTVQFSKATPKRGTTAAKELTKQKQTEILNSVTSFEKLFEIKDND
jgi:hypothetical protein